LLNKLDPNNRRWKEQQLARGCIGKKGATYAACSWDLMNDWCVSCFWASADRCVAA
jgi:hypothetical protein